MWYDTRFRYINNYRQIPFVLVNHRLCDKSKRFGCYIPRLTWSSVNDEMLDYNRISGYSAFDYVHTCS